MNLRNRTASRALPPLVALLVACGSGCTSVLSSVSLRELVRAHEHAAESAPNASDPGEADSRRLEGGEERGTAASAEADAERRQAAIEEAVARLSRLGQLGTAARATLVETLDRTEQEDWPEVIEAFATSLADAGVTVALEADPAKLGAERGSATASADAHVVAKADLDAGTSPGLATSPVPATAEAEGDPPPEPSPTDPPPVAEITPEPSPNQPAEQPVAAASVEPSPAVAGVDPPVEPLPATPGPSPAGSLAVRNACFASRVQAWGVVDRFAADRFRPGQEVIVYFELDNLSAGESPAGHTTCIDTVLRLVGSDGTVLNTWSFEPIAETCRARRRDYFARYVIRLPETTAADDCRLDLEVTDTLGRQVAQASLPLAILPPATRQ